MLFVFQTKIKLVDILPVFEGFLHFETNRIESKHEFSTKTSTQHARLNRNRSRNMAILNIFRDLKDLPTADGMYLEKSLDEKLRL